MVLQTEEKQRQEFRKILYDLAKEQEYLQDANNCTEIYNRLKNLYYDTNGKKVFRHFYSDILSVITQIQQTPNLGDINILGQNLEILKSNYISNKTDMVDISNEINKLYDHVSLEIARVNYLNAADKRISGEEAINNLQTKVNRLSVKIDYEIDDLHTEYESVEEKLDNSQKEYIAILGIFSAVVLTFTGGIAFSTSVFNNIAQSNIYRTIIVSLMIGLVFINILFGLFYYINSLLNKNKKIYPLMISNVVIIMLLLITIVAWHNGLVEGRNNRFNTEQNNYVSYSEQI